MPSDNTNTLMQISPLTKPELKQAGSTLALMGIDISKQTLAERTRCILQYGKGYFDEDLEAFRFSAIGGSDQPNNSFDMQAYENPSKAVADTAGELKDLAKEKALEYFSHSMDAIVKSGKKGVVLARKVLTGELLDIGAMLVHGTIHEDKKPEAPKPKTIEAHGIDAVLGTIATDIQGTSSESHNNPNPEPKTPEPKKDEQAAAVAEAERIIQKYAQDRSRQSLEILQEKTGMSAQQVIEINGYQSNYKNGVHELSISDAMREFIEREAKKNERNNAGENALARTGAKAEQGQNVTKAMKVQQGADESRPLTGNVG